MADFNTSTPEVSGGDVPRPTPMSPAAVAGNALGTLGSGLDNAVNGLFEGRRMHQQLLIRQATGGAEADLTQKLSTIADAVDSGQINSAYGRTQARAITTAAISNNPMLTEQLQAVHDKFIGDNGSGAVINKGTQQEQEQTSLRQKAQEAGWTNPSDPIDKQNSDAQAFTQFNMATSQLKYLSSQQEYTNLKLDQAKLQGDIRNANQAFVTGGIVQATDRITLQQKTNELQAQNAVGSMADGYTTNLNNKLTDIKTRFQNGTLSAQDAIMATDQAAAELKAATASIMGGAGAQYVNGITEPMQNTINSTKDYFSGKMPLEVLDNQINNNIGRQKLLMTGDPQNAKAFAFSELIKNPYLGLGELGNATARILLSNGNPNDVPHNMAQPTPQGQQDAKTYSGVILQGMKTLQSDAPGINKKNMQAEVDTHVGQMLTGVNAYQLAVKNPGDYRTLVSTIADPAFGKYMVDHGGKLPAGAAAGAQTVLQRDYTDVGVNLMREQYFTALNDPLKSASTGSNATTGFVPNMERPKDMTVRAEKITPVFDGAGVVFKPNEAKPDDATLASVRDLNRNVAPALNTLVRLDSHLSGSTNYEKTWNEKYLPRFQRLEPKQQDDASSGGGSAPTNPQ